MEIGIISGMIFGILLLLISFVSLFVSKRKEIENKWASWGILLGCCANITAIINSVSFL